MTEMPAPAAAPARRPPPPPRPPPRLLLVLALLLLLHCRCCSAQYLHHSRSPFGPWLPVVPEGCTESTGVWPHGGGNNPSPYIVDAEASALTGLPTGTVVIITTCNQGNRSHPSPNALLRAYMCVGIAQTWRHPVILNTSIMWALPDQNAYQNISVKTRPFDGFGSEDPFFYFDKRLKKWRALFHQMRRPATSDPKGSIQPNGPVDKWCGGYAESADASLFGTWSARSPQYGAYSKDIDLVRHGSPRSGEPPSSAPPPPPPGTAPAAPFDLGRSWPAYLNESLTSWGGNALPDESGTYHLFTSAMSSGTNHNAHASDLSPGPCGIGSWESDSLIIHAVSSSPLGPFKLADVALPSQHTNPQIARAPDGEWLLYTLGGINCTSCKNASYVSQPGGTGVDDRTLGYDKKHGCCSWCGYGACGGYRPHGAPPSKTCGQKTTPFAPLEGNVTLSRRERPKLLLDASGQPTHLYNAADATDIPGAANPNKGWRDRPFTIVTEILPLTDQPALKLDDVAAVTGFTSGLHMLIITVLAHVALSLDNGLGRLPIRGVSSWCVQGNCGWDRCWESQYESLADAIVTEGLRDANYTYLIIDDCW